MSRTTSLKRSFVVADLQREGMCNLLLVWAKAFSFASINDIPLYVHGWHNIRIGPWLRRENSKRYYANYFHKRTNHISFSLFKLFRNNDVVKEPSLQKILDSKSRAFVFSKVPSKTDYFFGIRDHRHLIVDGFHQMVKKEYLNPKIDFSKYRIGLHVRRGDFTISDQLRTSLYYFINIVNQLRSLLGNDLSIIVVSDGTKDELLELLNLPNITLFNSGSDISDLIALSKFDILVPSPKSTFGLWAGFISESDIILPNDYKGGRIRVYNEKKVDKPFEGSIDDYIKFNELSVSDNNMS